MRTSRTPIRSLRYGPAAVTLLTCDMAAAEGETSSLFGMASPPPSRWRSRTPKEWRRWEWTIAWNEAKAEAQEDASLYDRVRRWVKVLQGDPSTAQYWVGGTMPRVFFDADREQHPLEMINCTANKRQRPSPMATTSQASCEAWWPSPRCIAYIVGVGDEWGFPTKAQARGCIIHAYDPTTSLRASQEKFASEHNFTFHYAGLRGVSKDSTVNSYGAVEAPTLLTLDEIAAQLPAGERQPDILSIDCEGAPPADSHCGVLLFSLDTPSARVAGCEWAALEEIGLNPKGIRLLSRLKVLYLDMHFHLRQPVSVRQFVRAFELLFDRLHFKLAWLRNGNGYPAESAG